MKVHLMYTCRSRPLEEKFKALTALYKAPKNVNRLQTPNTNKDVWELMNRGVQIVDSSTQKVQNLLVSVLAVLTRLLDNICNDTAGDCADHVTELSDSVLMGVMGFTYLSQIRKECIRNALGYPLARFCTWDTPVGPDLLFENLPKLLKDREENRLKLRRQNNYR